MLPSEIEPAALAELVADARSLPAALRPRPRRVIDLTGLRGHDVITLPDSAVSLLDGYGEYGA